MAGFTVLIAIVDEFKRFFIKTRSIHEPVLPKNPFEADIETVERIKRDVGQGHVNFW